MGTSEKFTDERVIKNFVPTLARAWQKTITISKSDYENRIKQLLRTYEVLLKTLSALLYSRINHYNCPFPDIERFLKEKPTLGKFLRFNHACRKILRGQEDAFIQELKQALHQQLSRQAVINVCRTTMTELKEDVHWNKQAVTVRELFTILLELRNRTEHDVPPKKMLKALHEDLYLTLLELFQALQSILEEGWYVVQTIRTLPNRAYQYEMREFCGVHENLKEVISDKHLVADRLYTYDRQLQTPWIELWPMAHWDDTDNKIYLYNGFLTNKNAVFVNYASTGGVLHVQGKTFKELFKLPSDTSNASDIRQSPETSYLPQPEVNNRIAAMTLTKKNGNGDQRDPLIFVSYVRADDQRLPGEAEGWITILVKKLKQLLEKEVKHELQIEYPLNGHTRVTSEITEAVQRTPLLLVMLSRNYATSEWCQRKKSGFLDTVKERIGRDPNVFVVECDQPQQDTFPDEFEKTVNYPFWIENREPPVLLPTLPQDGISYHNRLTKLCQDLVEELQEQQRCQKYVQTIQQEIVSTSNATPRASQIGPLIFVNAGGEDTELREEICRTLVQLGAICLKPLTEGKPSEIREIFQEAVSQSDAIMLVYGKVSPTWVFAQGLEMIKLLAQHEGPLRPFAIYEGPPESKPPVPFDFSGKQVIECRNCVDNEKLQGFIALVQGKTTT